jgi:hypothetical protein
MECRLWVFLRFLIVEGQYHHYFHLYHLYQLVLDLLGFEDVGFRSSARVWLDYKAMVRAMEIIRSNSGCPLNAMIQSTDDDSLSYQIYN